jgi:hypothetical protein
MKKFLPVLILVLSGCSALGLATPKGFDQQLATGYGVHTAVVQATTVALTSGSISSIEAEVVQKQALASRQMLDTAKSIETSNPAGASNDLALATSALAALQSYLNSRSK